MKRFISCLCLCLLLAAPTALGEDTRIITPDAFRQNGTLPVYFTEKTDYCKVIDAEWFNQSGVKKIENWSKKGRQDHYFFNDGGELHLDNDFGGISYDLYDGKITLYYDNGDSYQADNPARAYWVNSFAYNACYEGAPPLENESLTSGTLEEAKETVQALLGRLGIGMTFAEAMDISVERLQTDGAKWSRELNSNLEPPDFSDATEDDEGFFLKYSYLIEGARLLNAQANAFVNRNGVVSFGLDCQYRCTDVFATPDKLLTADEIQNVFWQWSHALPQKREDVVSLDRIELTYAAIPAKSKKDGMLLMPVWYIRYSAFDGGEVSDFFWAVMSSIDGAVLDCHSMNPGDSNNYIDTLYQALGM